MLDFFKNSTSNRDDVDSNLTILDPPELNLHNVPSSPMSFRSTSSVTNAKQWGLKSKKSKNMMCIQSGLDGERERNHILEEQVQMLSYQAAKALDMVNEVTKANEQLKLENEQLRRGKQENSFKHSESINSLNSSLFSDSGSTALSQATSMQSMSDYIQGKDNEIQNIKVELDNLRLQYDESIQLISQLKREIALMKNMDNSNWSKHQRQMDMKHAIELDSYKEQLADLMDQLHERQDTNIKLRQRLMDVEKYRFDMTH